MAEYDEDIKKLIKKRLSAMSPDISFSVGGFGDFTRDQLIQEIDKGTEIGNEMIEMEVNFIRTMPIILKKFKR